MNRDRFTLLWEGLVAGMLGYAVVTLGMALANLLIGRSPFFTAAALGGALFFGVHDAASVQVAAGPILAYNGVHLLAFLVLGLFAARLARLAEQGPHFWYLGVLGFLFVAFHVMALGFLLPASLRSTMLAWTMVTMGFASSFVMAAYLAWTHPRIRLEWLEFSAQDPDLADFRR